MTLKYCNLTQVLIRCTFKADFESPLNGHSSIELPRTKHNPSMWLTWRTWALAEVRVLVGSIWKLAQGQIRLLRRAHSSLKVIGLYENLTNDDESRCFYSHFFNTLFLHEGDTFVKRARLWCLRNEMRILFVYDKEAVIFIPDPLLILKWCHLQLSKIILSSTNSSTLYSFIGQWRYTVIYSFDIESLMWLALHLGVDLLGKGLGDF